MNSIKDIHTIQAYSRTKGSFNKYINPILGKYNIKKITLEIIENFLIEIRSKEIGRSTYNKVRHDLSSLFLYAYENNYIKKNICKDLKNLNPFSEGAIWKPSTFRKFLLEIKSEKDRLFFLLLYITGAQPVELLSLNKDSFDFENDQININRIHPEFNSEIVETRKVLIPSKISKELKNYIDSTDEDYLFGKSLSYYQNRLDEISELKGLDKINLSEFRKSTILLLLKEKFNIITIQKRIGFKSLNRFVSIYSSLFNEDHQRLSKALNKYCRI